MLRGLVRYRTYYLYEQTLGTTRNLNEADFVREAIREKIRRDAPDFYASIFKEDKD